MTTSKGKAIVIDGNSLLYRAFFALPHFSTIENQPTNAVYGLSMMLLRLIQEEKPDMLVVAFDAPVKTFRHEEYKEYKAHRKSPPDDLKAQTKLARDTVRAFGAPMLQVEGYEADDIVGTVARLAENSGYDVTIVTGDLDALQLVDAKVHVMTTVKGVTETVIYDEKAVEERYGLRPDQLPDYKGLKGDTSDNIPGVPGVGDKSARKLLEEFGTLENLLTNLENVSNPKLQTLLTKYSEQAVLSKRLGTIITDVPLEIDITKCTFKKPDYGQLRELFARLEFKTLLKKIPADSVQGDLFDIQEPSTGTQAVVGSVLASTDELRAILQEVISDREISIRLHADSSRGVEAEPLGIALCSKAGKPTYIPFNAGLGLSLEDFRPVLESESVSKYGHNLKFEHEVLSRKGIKLGGGDFDTMIASYLLNPTRGTHDLAEVALDYAEILLPEQKGKGRGSSKEDVKQNVGPELGAEAYAISKLVPLLRAKLRADGQDRLMTEVEMPLMPILAEMELTGIAVDVNWLRGLSETLGARISALEAEIYELAGTDFNIGSPKQLQVILFEKLGLPSTKKTKTGYSTDADTLAALVPVHEIVGKILNYRELTKLKSTYADSLPNLINKDTGCIHTSLNQAVTATGRLSSSDPNLQNIPIKTEIGREIRRAFVASRGNVLISADYSQIELRILAHVSRDPALIEAFRNDEDIHTKTAVSLFGVSQEEVTPDMRRQAKTVNFAVIYGMSDYGLSRELNIPVQVAKLYIQGYFMQYPGVKEYASDTLSQARIKGYVESLLGRRRYMSELNSSNRTFREFAERAAVNMPIQGTAADIVKIAMIHVHDRLKAQGFKAKMVLQVHDELVFDAPEAEVGAVLQIIKDSMESAYPLDVPLKVSIKVGSDWCSSMPVSVEDEADTIS